MGWRSLTAMATKFAVLRTSSLRVPLCLLIGGLITTGISHTALAQITTPQSIQDLQNPERSDPFSNRGGSQNNGFLDLIHRAVLGPSRSLDEFNSEQRESLDSAAAEFRAKQKERLQTQPPAGPTNPTPAVVPATGSGN